MSPNPFPVFRTVSCLVTAALIFLLSPAASSQEPDPILQLKNRIIDIQNRGRLGFKDFTLCSRVLGFGSYVPLPSPKIRTGQKFLVYYRPVNVFTNRVKGTYEIWYTQDMLLLSQDKTVLYHRKDALQFHYRSWDPVLDLYVTNSLSLNGIPPGKYFYKAVLHDRLSNQSAEYLLPFEIVPSK